MSPLDVAFVWSVGACALSGVLAVLAWVERWWTS